MINQTETKPVERSIILRVRVCMAERGIRSVAALHRMLIEAGVEISHPQLLRVVDNRAQHLNVALLNGLLKVLSCRVEDLIGEAPLNA
jgi:DNA-binding Xre family transcriptional regulator